MNLHWFKINFLVAGLSLLMPRAQAQEPVQLGTNSSDCIGALLINDTVIGPVYSAPGYGNKLEIDGYELGDPLYIQREHNTVWYKFYAPYDAVFTFDLLPILQDDDFDYLLFKATGPNFCKEVADGTTVPIRTNISRKNLEVRGMTGLREGEVNDYVPSGPGSSYSKPLRVKKNELFYLLVDNPFRENKGHSIYLHWKRLTPEEAAKPEPEPEKKFEIPVTVLQLDVVDAKTKLPVASNITIDGVMAGAAVDYHSQSRISLELVSFRNYTINVTSRGYLMASKTVVPKSDSLFKTTIELKPISVGDRVTLENIKFEGDKTEILKKSFSNLNQLYDFLQQNPSTRIEISGHVNGLSKRNKKEYRELSTARAKAIQAYLIEKGIAPARLEYQGYGNKEMLYPEPVNKFQEEANRRVEIRILSL